MKNIVIFFFVLFAQLAFAQKFPVHYKIVQTNVNDDSSKQMTLYVSVHESRNANKQQQLELSLDGIEEIDLKDQSVNFSTFKTDKLSDELGISSNYRNFIISYINYPLNTKDNILVQDTAAFNQKLRKIIDEFNLVLTKDEVFLINNEYNNLFHNVYFNDFANVKPEQLKQSEFQLGNQIYKIKERNRRSWLVESTNSKDSLITSEIRFDPKSKYIIAKTLKIEGSSSSEGKTFNSRQITEVTRDEGAKVEKLDLQFSNMLLKGSYRSRYFKNNQDVDSVKFAQYISDYGKEFGSDPNYLKIILPTYQTMEDYDSYNQLLLQVPSKILANTYHLSNKVGIDELNMEDFLETTTLLSDDRLYDFLQSGLSQGIKSNTQNEMDRMDAIFTKLTDREKRFIRPMKVWATYKESSDNQAIQKGIDELFAMDDAEWKDGNAGRYIILLTQKQFTNGRTDLEDYKKLEKRLAVLAEDKAKDKGLINKAHLAFVNFSMFEALKNKDSELGWKYLKNAYDLSPKGNVDYEYQSYYDNFFTGSKKDYSEDYLAELSKRSGKDTVLKEYISEFTKAPAKSFAMLKQFYHENYDKAGFSSFLKADVFPKLENAPAFLLKDLAGKEVAPSHFAGKWTFIDFWGTWCGPCVAELPEFNSLYEKKYALMEDKLKILTISCYDREADLKNFISKNKYSFPVLISDGKVQSDYKIEGYPTKVLISPEGKMIPIAFDQDWKSLVEEFVSL